MAYVYRHIRLDKNEVFYIGIGSDTEGKYVRAGKQNTFERSSFWLKVAKKSPIETEIMLDDLTLAEAKQKEVEFIKLYGRKDLKAGTLVNLTDGGDGAFNKKVSKETGRLISRAKKKSVINNQKWLVLDTETGVYFYSVTEAAIAHNIVASTLHSKLVGKRTNNTNLRIA